MVQGQALQKKLNNRINIFSDQIPLKNDYHFLDVNL